MVAVEMTVSIRVAPASVFLTNKVFETTTRKMYRIKARVSKWVLT